MKIQRMQAIGDFLQIGKNLTLIVRTPFMPRNTYRSLPVEALYELLASSVSDMLVAYESKEDNMIAFNAMKKQVELLLEVIEEKKKELKSPQWKREAN